MPKWIEAEQGSNEWLFARIGNLTASRADDAFNGVLKKGGESEKRRKLKLDIIAERLTGRATEVYVTDSMKWGMKYEDEARQVAEDRLGIIIQKCGLAMHDEIYHFGASPDGLIQDDAIWECKCPSTSTFLKYKLEGVVPEMYRAQMLCQMVCTGRTWGLFSAYDPRLPPSINLFTVEFKPTPEELKQAENMAQLFLDEVQELMNKLLNQGEF